MLKTFKQICQVNYFSFFICNNREIVDDPSRWRILESDLYPIDKPAGRRRCNKCKELGHMAIRCPNKIYPKCKLCGQNGHFEPRCPNRLCTQVSN